MNTPSRKKIWPILIVILLAVFLRTWVVSLLPEDFDEPIYLQTAFDYATLIRDGDFQGLIDYAGVQEHPPFVKLLYSGAVLALGKFATWANAFYASRAISAIFGVLAVILMTFFVDPLSGGLLAIHTLAGKYTSQVYLEAVPHFMTIAAVLMFLRTDKERLNRWLVFSAIALGAAAASKYSYIPVILIVLAYLAFFEKKLDWKLLLGYAGIAVATFFLLDVYLWHDPIQRLQESLLYHVQYSQGTHVQEVGYPWFQPFVWIFTSAPGTWHENVFFYGGFDGLIGLLAVWGIKWEWKNRRWLVIWLAFGVLFLLLWPTKWPQYALTVTPPLCIMAAESIHRFIRWAREKENYWDYLKALVPKPGKWFWISIGAFVLFIAMIYLTGAIRLAVGRIGWSHITAQDFFLPSNSVNDILPLEEGRMLLATDQGVAIWIPPEATDQPPQWIIFDRSNSGIASNQVLSLAMDPQGHYWFGTSAGISSYDGEQWRTYAAPELGLDDARVLSLAAAGNGRVYAGTMSGATVWNGAVWSPIEQLSGETVFAISVENSTVWFGAAEGAGRLDVQEDSWVFYPTEAAVKHILVDSAGTTWAATSGNGLARLKGSSWTYLLPSNSDIPYSPVNWVTEIEPGLLWLGTSHPTQTGGTVATYNVATDQWHSFWTNNSGASGAEPLVIVQSSEGQIWIGTRTQGIDLYKLRR